MIRKLVRKCHSFRRMVSTSMLCLAASVFLTACGKSKDSSPSEQNSSSHQDSEFQLPSIESLAANGGDGRIEIKWSLTDDTYVDGYKVSWYNNNNSNSVTKKLGQKKGDQEISIMIDDIEEGSYLFEVIVFDKEGNSSEKASVTGKVYGREYKESVYSISFKKAVKEEDDVILEWDGKTVSDLIFAGLKIEYKDIDGLHRTKYVSDLNVEATLHHFPNGGHFKYQSLFLPDSSAIDTVFSGSFKGIVSDNFVVGQYYNPNSDTEYFLTTIRHKNSEGEINRLRLSLSDPLKIDGEIATDFADRMEATLVFNASIGTTETLPNGEEKGIPAGVQIVDGQILQDRLPRQRWNYALGVKEDNELIAYPSTMTAQEIIDDGALYAATAFVPLVENHQSKTDAELKSMGPPNLLVKHPRQVIGQYDNLDIVFLTTGGRGYGGSGMTAREIIQVLEDQNLRFIYNLDGGGSTSTVVDGEFINWKIDGSGKVERPRWNFFYLK